MSTRHLGLGIAVASALTFVAAGLVASPAVAASWKWTYSAVVGSETYTLIRNGEKAGSSTAKSNATVVLRDLDADNLGQRVYWRVLGASAWKSCVNTGGDGSSKTCNVTDGKFIQYQFCQKDGNVDVACAPQDGFQT